MLRAGVPKNFGQAEENKGKGERTGRRGRTLALLSNEMAILSSQCNLYGQARSSAHIVFMLFIGIMTSMFTDFSALCTLILRYRCEL